MIVTNCYNSGKLFRACSLVTALVWQKEELARRKANLLNNPAARLAWDEVKRRIRNRYGR
jgi:hypothetical protein